MVLKEEKRDLFSVSEECYLVHCISADFGMGKGIVVEFNKRFDMKRNLQRVFPDYINQWCHNRWTADCLMFGRVLNLITKERYFQKPTYESLKSSLKVMKNICKQEGITKIAMPIIGCGLDRLQWEKVKEIIKNTFKDMDIEILVCSL